MMNPDFIDNQNGNTMSAALKDFLGAESSGFSESSTAVDEARIATAFFSPEGFSRIAPAISSIPDIKLMLGTDPLAEPERWQKQLGETHERFLTRKLRDHLRKQEDNLRVERDHLPFTRDIRSALRQLVSSLRSGNMQVRRYEQNFMHAKAYIFTPVTTDAHGKSKGILAGSSNLTAAGLSSNLELNLGRYDTQTVEKAKAWFDALWQEATPFDLAAFFEEIFEPKTPFEIFLRVLFELYGEEVEQEQKIDENLPLTSFQKHGVVRALRLIKETGGAIVADEVGLGKTFIAGEVLAHYQDKRQRALLICPAALRDTSWCRFISDHQLHLEVVSFEELSRDKQMYDENRRPHATQNHLERNIDEYQLIIIDEAHNYRNPDSDTRADALRRLLYGKRKDLLMLTATPVNNSLWDLYHLTRFFIKQDSFLAHNGIISIKERFNWAMRVNPNDLSPDVLYPIVDATTVKRTREFIKKHYPGDYILDPDGRHMPIVFPEPKALSVRYKLDSLMPGLFDTIESYLDPENAAVLSFARYKADAYLKIPNPEEERTAHAVTGLLLSGLLKRFESSTQAFRISVNRMVYQHKEFLKALRKGLVVSTAFFKEISGSDDDDFDDLLNGSENTADASLYCVSRLESDVQNDLEKLQKLLSMLSAISKDHDPKLKQLAKELEFIAAQAKDECSSTQDEMQRRKVIIFSFFADSVRWIRDFLFEEINRNPKLSAFKGRLDIVVGSGPGEENNKATIAAKFAPETAGGSTSTEDLTDILISTDVLAEGVNLQQARHIINYDMPWNPMRLVQRHGRIDRIGSKHDRVFMRTIFPADRLNALLNLEERIARKIAMAAASIGVVSPIADVAGGQKVFAETREEIQKLLEEDASLYERGGTKSSTQSGEEYRQTLRKALDSDKEAIVNIPWKSGSGMLKGENRGIFFCAKAGERTYLRFVHTHSDWTSIVTSEAEDCMATIPKIDGELGTCLRYIECGPDEMLNFTEEAQDAAYDLWLLARKDIWKSWMHETDPANLQPKVRPINLKVAEFLRSASPTDIDQDQIKKAVGIIESPWPRRDEKSLRAWFDEDLSESAKIRELVKHVLDSGLEAPKPPEVLPPIKEDDIELLVWLAIEKIKPH